MMRQNGPIWAKVMMCQNGKNEKSEKVKLTYNHVRGANLRQIRIFFEHCSKGGGGVKPMFKKYVANFV